MSSAPKTGRSAAHDTTSLVTPSALDGETDRDLTGLRIAFVSGNYNIQRDGANRAQNMLVRYLLDHGAAVRVYSPTCDTPAFEPAGDLVSIPSSPMPFGRKEYRIAWRLPRSIRKDIAGFAPNLFHISVPLFHGRSALRLAHRMGVPAVAAMHTRFESYGSYYRLEFLVRPVLMALRRFYRGCDRVVAPSQPIADSMQAQGMGENIGIWTRGVDLQAFNPGCRDESWRAEHGFADGMPVIAFLGRVVAEKGLADFAETVARLRAEGADFRVLVIGDGPARAEFEQQLGDAVFTGFLQGEALARALASADVLLSPSSTEAFANVLLEAMASGVPVVAADAIGNSNIVVDGLTGALVQPGNIGGYRQAIRRYLADPALRKAHGFNARAHSQGFTWDRANAGIADVYLDVLAKSRHSRKSVWKSLLKTRG